MYCSSEVSVCQGLLYSTASVSLVQTMKIDKNRERREDEAKMCQKRSVLGSGVGASALPLLLNKSSNANTGVGGIAARVCSPGVCTELLNCGTFLPTS